MSMEQQPNTPESKPASQPGPEQGDNCGGDHQAALISANIDAGQSGVNIDVDALGVNVAEVSLGLGALDLPLGDFLHHC